MTITILDGGMGRALFVAHEDVANLVLLEQLVIDREDGPAGIAEHHLDALIRQGFYDHRRARHRLRHRSVPLFRSREHKKRALPDPEQRIDPGWT